MSSRRQSAFHLTVPILTPLRDEVLGPCQNSYHQQIGRTVNTDRRRHQKASVDSHPQQLRSNFSRLASDDSIHDIVMSATCESTNQNSYHQQIGTTVNTDRRRHQKASVDSHPQQLRSNFSRLASDDSIHDIVMSATCESTNQNSYHQQIGRTVNTDRRRHQKASVDSHPQQLRSNFSRLASDDSIHDIVMSATCESTNQNSYHQQIGRTVNTDRRRHQKASVDSHPQQLRSNFSTRLPVASDDSIHDIVISATCESTKPDPSSCDSEVFTNTTRTTRHLKFGHHAASQSR